MNLEPTIRWASAVLWHLNHPESSSCSAVSLDRMDEKLGWLRDFATRIQQWQTCLDAISMTLTFLNRQGIFPGVVRAYQEIITGLATCPASKQLTSDMKEVLRGCGKHLQPDEQLPLAPKSWNPRSHICQATRTAALEKWIHQLVTRLPHASPRDDPERSNKHLC